MSDSKIEMKADGFSGRVVYGTVTKVLPFAAILQLPDMIEVGYLHISQVSAERIDPPLTNTLKEGDRIEVLVKWFDEKHERWETSHKAIIQRQLAESRGLTTPGTRFYARVLKASELGAIVDMEGVPGTILVGREVWNAYSVFYHAGHLIPGESIGVVVVAWDNVNGRAKLRLSPGEPLELSRGAVYDGKVILIRKNVIRKIHHMHHDLYAKFVGGQMAWAMLTNVLEIDEMFPLGSTVPLVVGKYVPGLGMFEATVDWNRTNVPPPHNPEPGTVVEAMVVSVRDYGAICIISDRVGGLLHHSTIIEEKSGDTRRHLRPGDVVRAIVEHPAEGPLTSRHRLPGGGRMTINVEHPPAQGLKLKFLQLVDRTLDTETTESSDLIDLRVSRRPGRPSGFDRDQDFRWNVLEAFDHTCCVCGVRHVFGKASAMEAAHIIPRARRGADTTRNSLCLCSLHHWAFDRGFLTVDENFCVVIARQIIDLGEPGSLLTRYHGKNIHVTDPTMIISIEAIQWHRQNIFFDERD